MKFTSANGMHSSKEVAEEKMFGQTVAYMRESGKMIFSMEREEKLIRREMYISGILLKDYLTGRAHYSERTVENIKEISLAAKDKARGLKPTLRALRIRDLFWQIKCMDRVNIQLKIDIFILDNLNRMILRDMAHASG